VADRIDDAGAPEIVEQPVREDVHRLHQVAELAQIDGRLRRELTARR
jgi:hypothetical protein